MPYMCVHSVVDTMGTTSGYCQKDILHRFGWHSPPISNPSEVDAAAGHRRVGDVQVAVGDVHTVCDKADDAFGQSPDLHGPHADAHVGKVVGWVKRSGSGYGRFLPPVFISHWSGNCCAFCEPLNLCVTSLLGGRWEDTHKVVVVGQVQIPQEGCWPARSTRR